MCAIGMLSFVFGVYMCRLYVVVSASLLFVMMFLRNAIVGWCSVLSCLIIWLIIVL